jgi:hypothetical protein
MIIWGGFGDSFSNIGERYDPDTDSWTFTSSSNAPEARVSHTAVWTGSEMIVWGGGVANSDQNPSRLPLAADTPLPVTNTGGRYCAAAPSPTPTPTLTPQPTPTPSEPPCEVVDSQPACNSIVSTAVTDFTVYVSYFISGSVPASAFTVNGIPADNAAVSQGEIFFHFNVSPVVQGENSMHIPADAFSCLNGRGVDEFTCTFTAPRSAPAPRVRPTPAPRP